MHRKVKSDPVGGAHRFGRKRLPGEIGRRDFVAFLAQPRGWGSQPKGLPSEIVGGNQNDAHDRLLPLCGKGISFPGTICFRDDLVQNGRLLRND
jgi:hypothetical protein